MRREEFVLLQQIEVEVAFDQFCRVFSPTLKRKKTLRQKCYTGFQRKHSNSKRVSPVLGGKKHDIIISDTSE